MKPYNERLPLIDAAIDGGWLPHQFISDLTHANRGDCIYFVDGFWYHLVKAGESVEGGEFVGTIDEFNQRKAQWEKLYEWISSRNEEIKKRGFGVLFSMPKELLDDWIKEAEHWGSDWQDTLEERPMVTEKCGTINNLRFGGYGIKDADTGLWTFAIPNEKRQDMSDIATESWREYTYTDGYTVFVDNPSKLLVRDSGAHCVVDKDGVTYYVPDGWRLLRWKDKNLVTF